MPKIVPSAKRNVQFIAGFYCAGRYNVCARRQTGAPLHWEDEPSGLFCSLYFNAVIQALCCLAMARRFSISATISSLALPV